MGRLIDAEKYPCNNCTVSYCYKNCKKNDAWLEGCDYDTEKVVEKLEVLHDLVKDNQKLAVSQAIEIVRKGGAE